MLEPDGYNDAPIQHLIEQLYEADVPPCRRLTTGHGIDIPAANDVRALHEGQWVGQLLGLEVLALPSIRKDTTAYMRHMKHGIPNQPFHLHAYVDGSGGSDGKSLPSWAVALFAVVSDQEMWYIGSLADLVITDTMQEGFAGVRDAAPHTAESCPLSHGRWQSH